MPDRFMDCSCQTVSLAEAAQVLGIGRSTVYKLARQGALPVPVLEIGPVLRVSAVHLARYLATAIPIRPQMGDQVGGE
jgi:excisionase family DNA binding protein